MWVLSVQDTPDLSTYPSCSEDGSFHAAGVAMSCLTHSAAAAWAQPPGVTAGPAWCWVPFDCPLTQCLLPSNCTPSSRTPAPSAPLSHGTSTSLR